MARKSGTTAQNVKIKLDKTDKRMLKQLSGKVIECENKNYLDFIKSLLLLEDTYFNERFPSSVDRSLSVLFKYATSINRSNSPFMKKAIESLFVEQSEAEEHESDQLFILNFDDDNDTISYQLEPRIANLFSNKQLRVLQTAVTELNKYPSVLSSLRDLRNSFSEDALKTNREASYIRNGLSRRGEWDSKVDRLIQQLDAYRSLPYSTDFILTSTESADKDSVDYNMFIDSLCQASSFYTDPTLAAFLKSSDTTSQKKSDSFAVRMIKNLVSFLSPRKSRQYIEEREAAKLSEDITFAADTLIKRNLDKVKVQLEDNQDKSWISPRVKDYLAGFFSIFVLAAGLFEILDGVVTVLGMFTLNPVLFGVLVSSFAVIGLVAFIAFEVVQFFQELGINLRLNTKETARHKQLRGINKKMLEICNLLVADKDSLLGASDSEEQSSKYHDVASKKYHDVASNFRSLLLSIKNNSESSLYVRNVPSHEGNFISLSREFYPYFYLCRKKNDQILNLCYLDELEKRQQKIRFYQRGHELVISLSSAEEGVSEEPVVKFDLEKFTNSIPKSGIKRFFFSESSIKVLSAVISVIVAFTEGSSGFYMGYGLIGLLGVATGPTAPLVLGLIGAIGFCAMGLIINYYAIQRLLKNFSQGESEIVTELDRQNSEMATSSNFLSKFCLLNTPSHRAITRDMLSRAESDSNNREHGNLLQETRQPSLQREFSKSPDSEKQKELHKETVAFDDFLSTGQITQIPKKQPISTLRNDSSFNGLFRSENFRISREVSKDKSFQPTTSAQSKI